MPAKVRMPGEWEPHHATWIAWPHNPKDWPGKINEIIASYSSYSFLDILTPEGKLVEHLRIPGWSYGGTFDGEGNYIVIKEEEEGYFRVVKYGIFL